MIATYSKINHICLIYPKVLKASCNISTIPHPDFNISQENNTYFIFLKGGRNLKPSNSLTDPNSISNNLRVFNLENKLQSI